MLHDGPIVIIIDDDGNDLNLFTDAIESLNHPNDIILIEPADILDLLKGLPVVPSIILSPLTAFAVRNELLHSPGELIKYIPYIFYCSSSDEKEFKGAYPNQTDGFFLRPENAEELTIVLSTIFNYWSHSVTPADRNGQLSLMSWSNN